MRIATSTRAGVAVAVWIGLLPIITLGLPSPKTETELINGCDVAGVFRVVDVAVVGISRDFLGLELLVYQAWLQMQVPLKGQVEKSDTVIVQWREVPQGIWGLWAVCYKLGELVKTHLVKAPDSDLYRTYWWNAAETIEEGSPDHPYVPGDLRVIQIGHE